MKNCKNKNDSVKASVNGYICAVARTNEEQEAKKSLLKNRR
jgi:hypothetical protein